MNTFPSSQLQTTNFPQKNLPNDIASILNIGEEKEEIIEKSTNSNKGLTGFYARINEKVQSFTPIKVKEKVTFFQLLAVMLEAGVPLVKALYVLADQNNNIRLRHTIATIAQKVETGKSFSSAMQDFYGVFNDTQIGMIHAGEASGKLNEILKQVAKQEEKNAAITSKIKGAMIYPAIVLTIMACSVLVILGFVVPQLTELFTQAGSTLPTSTKILIFLSDFVINSYKFLIGIVVIIIGIFYVWKKTDNGKYQWHHALLYLPIMGKLLRQVALSRFTRTLASLMNSGITIVKSLQIDGDAVGNEVYKKRILLAAEDVSRGIPLAENLTDSRFLFPEMVVSMISIGEQAAELANVCDKIADYYEDQVDQMAANISKLLEPLIMVAMSVVVGGLIVAVMQPIFSLMDVVGNI